MTNVVSADETRRNLSSIVDRARFQNERFIVTKSGKPWVIIIGVNDYEKYILNYKEIKELTTALKKLKNKLIK